MRYQTWFTEYFGGSIHTSSWTRFQDEDIMYFNPEIFSMCSEARLKMDDLKDSLYKKAQELSPPGQA